MAKKTTKKTKKTKKTASKKPAKTSSKTSASRKAVVAKKAKKATPLKPASTRRPKGPAWQWSAVETAAATLPFIKSNRLRAYGISTAKPSSLAPGIEPFATALNLPGFDAAAWIGVMVPAGTPKAVIERLSKAVDSAMQTNDTRERLNAAGLEVDYRPTREFGGFLMDQRKRFADIIKKNHIHLD